MQTASEYGCNCVAYVDARQVQDKLDTVVGPNNWRTRYETIDGQLFCHLGIWDAEKKEWVEKSDTGTESMADKEKGQVSDAFKRAAVQWGVGRFLYSLGIKKTKSIKNNRGKFVPAENGKQIWDLTKHFKTDRPVAAPARPAVKAAPISMDAEPKTDTYTQSGRPERYSADKANGSYKTHTLSADTLERIKTLKRDGTEGKAVLINYLAKYNEANKTSLNASELKTDAIVNSLIDFIDNTPPAEL